MKDEAVPEFSKYKSAQSGIISWKWFRLPHSGGERDAHRQFEQT
jgi:hypothetical protein